jgi:hypothetical protein
VFGASPAAGRGAAPSLAPRRDCTGCEKLRAGPKVLGLHPAVLRRLRAIERSLPPPRVNEPVLWINSGKRDGPRDKSLHNQGLAVDLVICGLSTAETAQHLRRAGFTCVIEYHDSDGNPCNMAHGDLRNTKWARGSYAPGGRKSRTCPRKAKSKTSGCGNQYKQQWRYDGD